MSISSKKTQNKAWDIRSFYFCQNSEEVVSILTVTYLSFPDQSAQLPFDTCGLFFHDECTHIQHLPW